MIQNLPHGFYEEQLQGYFSQYGAVTRLRLARSERTGRSRGYAFIEFKYPEVAQVAAESMNNYLMFKQILKTIYIPPKEQRFDYFKQKVNTVVLKDGTEKLITPQTIRTDKHVKNINKPVTDEQHAIHVERDIYK